MLCWSVLAMALARTYVFFFLTYWLVAQAIEQTTTQDPKDLALNVTERALKHGYAASEHTVVTQDGYILTVFRIQKHTDRGKRPPVLLMHGLLLSADSWLDAGPTAGLAYLLARSGHDVWLGNVRGTHYSRAHSYLHPDADPRYWHFSVDEIGRYDTPATVDYILQQTGAERLNYIGFSQGNGIFYVMCSERPEYCKKINVLISLAPATILPNTKSVLFRFLCEFYEINEQNLIKSKVYEALTKDGLTQRIIQTFCLNSDESVKNCVSLLGLLDASHPGSITIDTFRTFVTGFPAGTSVHNLAKYGQMLRSKHFKKFDYGKEENFVRYGKGTPPIYNLTAVTVPTVVLYGRNDGIVDKKDVEWLIGQLPNVIEAVEVSDPSWTHVDFNLSRKVPKLVYPKIEEYLDTYGL